LPVIGSSTVQYSVMASRTANEAWSKGIDAGTYGSGQPADRTDKSRGRTSNNGFNSAMPTDMDKQLLAPRMEKIYILTSTQKR